MTEAMSSSIPRTFHLAVAFTSRTQGIGKAGKLPWRLSRDLAYFKELTSKTSSGGSDLDSSAAAVLALARNVASSNSSTSPSLPASAVVNATIMGRKTWESIPSKFRPLPGRLNVVLSRSAMAAAAAAANDENATPVCEAAPPATLTSAKPMFEGAVAAPSLDAALALLSSPALSKHVERVFVIGGGSVYAEALEHAGCTAAHVTRVFEDDVDDTASTSSASTSPADEDNKFGCDVFFPRLDPEQWRLWATAPPRSDAGVRYRFETWVRAEQKRKGDDEKDGGDGGNGSGANGAPSSSSSSPATFPEGGPSDGMPPGASTAVQHAEEQYLSLIREILGQGVARGDRTGTGTLSVFGRQMRFDLREGLFPLLTTKRVFWRGVVEELLWFVRGCTDATQLSAKGIKIWDGNGSRAFLDAAGLGHRAVGDLGPVYGFQWRHFGASYSTAAADYEGRGVDQLADVIDQIKNNPQSRRIVLTAWNPAALSEMALPPCHMFAQFYVARGELSCQMYQRSADMGEFGERERELKEER